MLQPKRGVGVAAHRGGRSVVEVDLPNRADLEDAAGTVAPSPLYSPGNDPKALGNMFTSN